MIELLKKYWGYTAFKPLQQAIIESVLEGNDTLALLPTGGGKSLCYQLPALMMEGSVLVVSPLIALMEDQVQQLSRRGIKAMYFKSDTPNQTVHQQIDNCIHGNYKVVYTSPERLAQPAFKHHLSQAHFSLLAIDESHCISSWGHDFRPTYRKLNELRDVFPSVPLLALTATATPEVVKDIIENLEMKSPRCFQGSFDRPNIAYQRWITEDKKTATTQLLKQYNQSSIVYCPTRKMTENWALFLQQQGLKADFFHGGITQQEKKEKLKEWQAEKVVHMVATTAFGMGIDKANVRTIVHVDLPESVEAYYQETGRAGRDGQAAQAILLFHPPEANDRLAKHQKQIPTTAEVEKMYKAMYNYFHIARGEGLGETVPLELSRFATRYSLSKTRAHHLLTLFEKAGVIALQYGIDQQKGIQMKCTVDQAKAYLQQHTSDSAILLEALMRHYPHLFLETKSIQLTKIASRLQWSSPRFHSGLSELEKSNLIQILNTAPLSITFLQARNDQQNSVACYQNIIQVENRKEKQLKAMLSFASTSKGCKRNQLLAYFGETADKSCGQCFADACRPEAAQENNLNEKVVSLLQRAPHSIQELKQKLYFEPEALRPILHKLLQDQMIFETDNHQYVWNHE